GRHDRRCRLAPPSRADRGAPIRRRVHDAARGLARHLLPGRRAMRRLSVLLGLAVVALAAPAAAAASGIDYHPEDEFKLDTWVSIHIGPLDMSINKAVVYLLLATVLTIALGIGLMRARLGVRPGTRQTIGETIYEVAQVNIAEQGLPTKAIGIWFPYVATLLLFIWVLNFIG